MCRCSSLSLSLQVTHPPGQRLLETKSWPVHILFACPYFSTSTSQGRRTEPLFITAPHSAPHLSCQHILLRLLCPASFHCLVPPARPTHLSGCWCLIIKSHLHHHCMVQTHSHLALPVLVGFPATPTYVLESCIYHNCVVLATAYREGHSHHSECSTTMVTTNPFLPPPFSPCLLFSPSLPSCLLTQSKLIQ